MTTLTLARSLNEGLRRALEDDPKVMIMGEDVGKLGGVFRITDGLQKDFGEGRVMDTPLAESGIVGTAIGLALRGYRPVCEIQFDGFVYPATDQIVSQLAKMRYRSRGSVTLPVVIRIPFGGGIGAVEHHSESPEVFFAHTAGLRVVACADPADAFAMIQLADRGQFFVEPGQDTYEGMVVGINPRAEDLDINITREKKLTNMRSSTADVIETLARPLELDLEQAMEFCAADECVEVTPEIVRVRKVELDATSRARSKARAKARG